MTQRFLLIVLFLFVLTVGRAAEPSLVINSGGNTRQIEDVVFTKDGQYLVSVGNDRVIRIWDVKTGETVRAIRDQVSVCADCKISALALTPDNKYLALSGKFPGTTADERYAIHVYDFQTGERVELLKGHKSKVISLTFSGDGTQLASGSAFPKSSSDDEDPIHLWTLGSQGWRASRSFGKIHREAVESLAFSPDGNHLLSAGGGSDKNLFLWKLSGSGPPTERSLSGHRDAVLGAAFSPDGQSMVSAGLDRQIILWDVQGKLVRVVSHMESNAIELALSPIKEHWHISVGLENGTAPVLSLPEGKIVKTLRGRRDKIGALAFSPDESLVAGSGGFDGQIWLWNTSSGESADGRGLVGKGRAIWSLGFSNDGNSFAFGTERTTDEPNKYGPLQQVMWLKSPDQPSEYRIALGPRLKSETGYYQPITSVGEYDLRTRFGKTVPRTIGNPDPIRLDELLLFNKKTEKQVDFNRRLSTSGRSHLSYSFTHNGQYVVSGGENGYLALYETRNLRQPVIEFEGHTDSVWAVAVSPNGRFILSGSSDQTIKLWDIKSKDWLLSIFVTVDNEWVAWTPQGYYTSSLGGDRYIGWHVKEEGKKRPDFYRAEQFQKVFYRPDVVARYLTTFGTSYEAVEPTVTAGPRTCGTGIKTTFDRWTRLIGNLPPKIEIISPAKDVTVVDRRVLNLKIIVTSVNLPITNVQVTLNGFQRGSFIASGDEAEPSCKVELDTMVALKPDENTLVVSAAHAAATSSAEVRKITFKAPAKTIDVSKPSANSPMDLPGTDMARGPQWTDSNAEFLVTSFDGSRETFKTPPRVDGADNPPTPVAVPDAPTIEILDPSQSDTPIEVTEQYFIMTVRIPAATPGRKFKVRIFDNKGGTPQTQDIQPGEGTEMSRLLVEEGEYEISVIAIVDGVESTPQVRKVKYANLRPPKGKLLFLGIGIKDYTSLQPGLRWADKDANDLASFLSGLENSALFETVDPVVLSNHEATRERIIEEVDKLNLKATNENDLRIVLFSGHGGTFGEELDRYYFYVQDYKKNENPSLKNPEWSTIVNSFRDRGNGFGRGPVLVLVDTCRSGKAIPKDFMDAVKKLNTLVLFAASGAQENAYEDSSWRNGAFTRAVLEGLSGCADSSRPGRPSDGIITALELGGWLVDRVKELNAAQNATPYYPVGGDFSIPVRTDWTITLPSIGSLPINCTGVPR